MFKKSFYVFAPLIVGCVLFFFVFDGQFINIVPSSSEGNRHEHAADKFEMIDRVYALAQEGRIPDLDAIAGESRFEEIANRHGEPERIDETSVGDYAIYGDGQITVGYRDAIAYDLRSRVQEPRMIRYWDILERLGDPHDERYYQDDEHDHLILIYDANEEYQLKWIVHRPNEKDQNPEVSHISVVASQALELKERVDRMSVEEKVGQMVFAGVTGTEPDAQARQLIHDHKVGGIIFNAKNLASPSQTVAYVNFLKTENKNNPIPLFFGVDQEGGRVSKLPGGLVNLPTNERIGQRDDPSFSYEIGRVLGKLTRAYGFNVNFAPVLDVNSNPNNPVIGDRSFGHRADLVSRLGVQTMKGLQSENIIPTIKHFPGHGDTAVDSHFELPMVNKTVEELEQLELIPFKRAINEGADMVMVAHLMLPRIDSEYPSSLSENVITELLRNRLGFDGVIITDDLTMGAIADQYDIGRAAVQSIKAGGDIVMIAHDHEKMTRAVSALRKAVNNGEIEEERINESVARILRLKEKYKIDDSLTETPDANELNQLIQSALNNG